MDPREMITTPNNNIPLHAARNAVIDFFLIRLIHQCKFSRPIETRIVTKG
jgi:hypothetical protein